MKKPRESITYFNTYLNKYTQCTVWYSALLTNEYPRVQNGLQVVRRTQVVDEPTRVDETQPLVLFSRDG